MLRYEFDEQQNGTPIYSEDLGLALPEVDASVYVGNDATKRINADILLHGYDRTNVVTSVNLDQTVNPSLGPKGYPEMTQSIVVLSPKLVPDARPVTTVSEKRPLMFARDMFTGAPVKVKYIDYPDRATPFDKPVASYTKFSVPLSSFETHDALQELIRQYEVSKAEHEEVRVSREQEFIRREEIRRRTTISGILETALEFLSEKLIDKPTKRLADFLEPICGQEIRNFATNLKKFNIL